MSALVTAAGVLMMGAAVLLLGYVATLDLAHVRQVRWYERRLLVAVAALGLLLLGGLLAVG